MSKVHDFENVSKVHDIKNVSKIHDVENVSKVHDVAAYETKRYARQKTPKKVINKNRKPVEKYWNAYSAVLSRF